MTVRAQRWRRAALPDEENDDAAEAQHHHEKQNENCGELRTNHFKKMHLVSCYLQRK